MSLTTAPTPPATRDPQSQGDVRRDDPRGTGGGGGDDRPARRAPAWRFPLVALLALGLVAGAREGAQALRGRLAGAAGGTTTTTSLSNMNSFALALLLGGLRGPLVMLLWTSSETQKSEKKLEDFDTKVEWIRLLQPEFDTVHIFQIWNKAYNISVQMASPGNKYLTILDAIKYAKDVDAERPHNINIVHAIGGVYYDKLGNAAEKNFYRKSVREQTLPHPEKQKLKKGDPGWRPLEHEAMLDDEFRVLPQYREAMQHVTKYEPFPQGLSPLAIGYSYFKEAQDLLRVGKQRHAQLSELVVDSRPALSLRGWGEEEWERGRRVELAALGRPAAVGADRLDLELPTAGLPLNQPIDPGALRQAVDDYDRAAALIADAIDEYRKHLEEYKNNLNTYLSHLDHLNVVLYMTRADRDYLKAMMAAGDARQPLLRSARDEYAATMDAASLVILRYYMDDSMSPQVFQGMGDGINRANFHERLNRDQVNQAIRNLQILTRQLQFDSLGEDRAEYERYGVRAQTRLQLLEGQVR